MCFKNKLHAKYSAVRECHVILRDIFKCNVDVERLPEYVIDKANEGTIRVQPRDVTSNQHDHNYSKNYFDSCYVVTNRTAFHSLNDSDTSIENSDDDSECHANDDDVDNVKSSHSDDSFEDFDYDSENYENENDDNVCNSPYSINRSEVDSDDENSFVPVTGVSYVITNREAVDHSNGTSSSDSGVYGAFSPISMDNHEMNDSPAILGDEDEDLEFLIGIKEMLNQNGDVTTGTANRRKNGEVWPENQIFGDICVNYLHGICYSTYCGFPHQLPTKEHVESQLKLVTCNEIEAAQNDILLRHDNLLTEFSAVFCTFYGRQRHRESLRELIPILSKKPMATIFMQDILNGFLISGMKYSTCVNLLLIEIDSSLNTEERFEIMWPLIIDAQNDKADLHLKEFEEVLNSDSLIAAEAINKMIELQMNGDLESLRDIVIKCVKKAYVTTFQKIDPKLLKAYIRHVRSFDPAAAKAIEQKSNQFGVVLES